MTTVWNQGGWVGVDLFFVLSGFLVSGLLFREQEETGKVRVGRFLIRRGFKIYPPFWLLLAATVLVAKVLGYDIMWPNLLAELFFVQNYAQPMWNHTWSLAVEEHFYLLLALGFLALTRWKPRHPFKPVPLIFVAIAGVSLLLRIVWSHRYPFNQASHYFVTHLRLDSLFFGVFISYWFHKNRDAFLSFARRWRHALAGAGWLLLLPAFCYREDTPFIYVYGLTLFYLGAGCLLISAMGFQAPAGGLGKAVASFGARSYSVYLWHMPVGAWGGAALRRLLPQYDTWSLHTLVYLAGSVVFGMAMAGVVEGPVLKIRDRLFPSLGSLPVSRPIAEEERNRA